MLISPAQPNYLSYIRKNALIITGPNGNEYSTDDMKRLTKYVSVTSVLGNKTTVT